MEGIHLGVSLMIDFQEGKRVYLRNIAGTSVDSEILSIGGGSSLSRLR
jgi:hypothetical protein